MRKLTKTALIAGFLAAALAACGSSDEFDPEDHADEIADWQEWRLEQLKDPDGYLHQTGLFWIQPGTHTFGGGAHNDVVFGDVAADDIGFFTLDEDGVSMRVMPGVEVRIGMRRVEEMQLPADTSGEDVIVTHGSLSWQVIEREGRYAIRLRDDELAFVDSFGPLPYFETDPGFRVEATLHRYPQPIKAKVGTVIEGLGFHPESPGVVGFDLDGETYALEAYVSGEQFFYVFGDLTNQDETYGAGRFLYSALPDEEDRLILDFNKSYSPPCAFNDFSTCPIASSKNRLAVRIEAGEKHDPALHFSANP